MITSDEDATPRTLGRFWTDPAWMTVDSERFPYRVAGQGEPLLFLHGAGMTRRWLPLYEHLASNFTVFVPEHPGYGDSPLPANFRDFSDYVIHYDAVVRELGLEGAHLVGHSLGGRIAAHLCTYYPTRFQSLALVTPAGLRVPGVPLIDTFRMTDDEALFALFNGRSELYTEYLVQEGFPEDDIKAYEEATTTALLVWTNRFDLQLESRLGRIQTPTLVIGAQKDQIIATETARRYSDLIPEAQLRILMGHEGQDSGHMMIVEQPRDLADILTEFVADLRK